MGFALLDSLGIIHRLHCIQLFGGVANIVGMVKEIPAFGGVISIAGLARVS